MGGRKWTDEELVLLEELTEKYPLETVARRLNRTKEAVFLKRQRIGMGGYMANTDMLTRNTVSKILGIENRTLQYWERKGLKSYRKRPYVMYRQEDIIKYMREHPEDWNAATIIDLHDRSVIASITDRNITSDLAIRTLRKALESQPTIKDGLILHSDQGSQYTSKAFTEFCESVNVTQSMSKAGYPYDNAPMERYFNTLKNECTNLYEFTTEETLYQKVEEFAYVDYNHVRPHSYNGYRTPYEARTAA